MTDALAARPTAPWRAYTTPSAFRGGHKWDHNFFIFMVGLIWLGILMGFVPQIARHFTQHQPAYPAIIHVHAAVFVGWLCLLTAQVLLVRFGRTDWHRRLGVAAIVLFAAVAAVGPTTAIVMHRIQFGTPRSDPPFIAIQLADMLTFTVLGGAAILLRKTPQAHKRLMLLAVIFISDAGFARWWGGGLFDLLGKGFWPTFIELYLGDVLLVGLLGAYDWITRRRLHPVYVFGAAWGVGFELVAVWLLLSPWWKPVADALIGH